MKKHTVYYALAALALSVILTLCGWRYYIGTIEKSQGADLSGKAYERHYVMIPDDADSELWQDIYQSAAKEARQQNAYVELLADWAVAEYSLTDYMNIAVASAVDGIIVKPDGTARVREAVNCAEEAGIPVITILDDDTASSRTSFVGVNSYQIGTTYGRQVLRCVDDRTKKVTVLLNDADSGKELTFKELKATVLSGLSAEREGQVEIQLQTIHSQADFEAEEVIRDLINDAQTRPDILVCTNETDSVCAYHAMVDYNLVGSMDIIGYYQSDTILSAIEKGTVPMAVTLNAQQIGQRAVEALEEYWSMGYASSYFSVDLSVITRQNVGRFRQKDEGED